MERGVRGGSGDLMIVITCSNCGQKLKGSDDLVGRAARCPRCGQSFRVSAGLRPGRLRPAAAAVTPPPAVRPLPRRAEGEGPPLALAEVDAGFSEGSSGFAPASRSEADDFLAPPQAPGEIGRLGPYRVLRRLGAGAMGVVFEAEDGLLKRKVALKVMPPAQAGREIARQRFLREAQAAAAIEHDHVVTIHQVGEDRGLPYLAMPLLKGAPLHEVLAHTPQLAVEEVLRIGREIALGLAAAHARGLMHRDIKPANIWLEAGTGRVKILDFGLARALADDARMTQVGKIVGTPAYMAPEQSRGQVVDARCDLFSLGCVLYQACTGRLPFTVGDTVTTLLAVATEEPAPPVDVRPEVPPALSDLVMQLLAKDPDERPPSAQAVVEAIDAIVSGPWPEPVFAPPVVRQRAKPSRRPRKWLAAGIAGLVVLGVSLAWWGFGGAPPEQTKKYSPPTLHAAEHRADHQPVRVPVQLPAVDPDRRAAEWVLALGGKANLATGDGGTPREVTARADLPKVFRLQRVNLAGNRQVTDAGLSNLEGLAVLDLLWLSDTPITDAGLAHLRGLGSLQLLNLGQTPITDRGLEHLRGLTGLQVLYLDGTHVGDVGLKHLASLEGLRELYLARTGVSDAGLESLRHRKQLRKLHLEGTAVSDEGLRRLKAGLPGCEILREPR